MLPVLWGRITKCDSVLTAHRDDCTVRGERPVVAEDWKEHGMTERMLPGHWRRTPGTKVAHLWHDEARSYGDRPLCGARLTKGRTEHIRTMEDGPSCRAHTECLVEGIRYGLRKREEQGL